MVSDRNLLAGALFALASQLTAAHYAFADDSRYIVHTVSYECPNEPPQTFTYVGGKENQYGTAPLEAQWYWERTRPDRGAGCKIMTIDGLPFR